MRGIFFFTFLIISNISWAQNGSIRGMVRDAISNEKLPYASISLVDFSNGTVSNGNGAYVLDLAQISSFDTLLVSYMGYETSIFPVAILMKDSDLYLKPAAINLSDLPIYSRDLEVKDILVLIIKNFSRNYPKKNHHQRIFYHRYSTTPFNKENEIILKKSNFENIDKNSVAKIVEMIPDDIVQYQDTIIDKYSFGDSIKLVPIEGISLEENSNKDLETQIKEKFKSFSDAIENSLLDEDIYYKIGSGIFSGKIDSDDQNLEEEDQNDSEDSLYFLVTTRYLKYDIKNLMTVAADIDSKDWEFVKSPRNYNYSKELTLFNNAWVYKIVFQPKEKGLYEGVMYVSVDNYAILELDFNYALGKNSQNFNLLGVSHSLKYKGARVIYQKGPQGYFVKYINAEKNEFFSLDRNIFLVKKGKRFLFDKELNKVKLALDMSFDTNSSWELLVINDQLLEQQPFEDIEEPKFMKFKKEFIYDPKMWENPSVIVPNEELQKYKRSQ